MKVRHEMARRRMPLLVDAVGGKLKDHVDTCISCQAEASRYRSLQRILGSFSSHRYEAPYDLVPGVMAGLQLPVAEVKRQVKAGTAAVVAGAVAGAVVIARLARRRAA
jgi:hypothetical protein